MKRKAKTGATAYLYRYKSKPKANNLYAFLNDLEFLT